MKKRVFSTVLCLALMTALAMAMTVTGAAVDENTVSLGNSSWYDRSEHVFVYRQSNGAEIKSSVANEMVTTDEVRLEVPAAIAAKLYRDGEEAVEPDYGSIRTPGNYVLTTEINGIPNQLLKFTILNAVSGAVYTLQMPENFIIDRVELDGVEQTYTPYVADLSQEGTYRVVYYCVPSRIPYELNVTVDHTAPVLALEAVVDGVAKGPVDLSDLEDGAAIYIEHDGQQLAYTTSLKESGSYVVTVKDQAGNVNTYKFMIQVYFNISSLMIFALTLVIAISLIAYVLVSRKALRVR